MSYNSIAWLPLALGLTILGLVLSYFAYRRRGLRPALLGTAWSLLPIAAYLTGSIEMLWKIGAAIGQFGSGFVFSPMKWAGVGVTGLALALFLAAGGRRRRKAARETRRVSRAGRGNAAGQGAAAGEIAPADRTRTTAAQAASASKMPVPATRRPAPAQGKARNAAQSDDDMKDIEDILRKRGI